MLDWIFPAKLRTCKICDRSGKQAQRMIVGKKGGICTDCVRLCNDIIAGKEAVTVGEKPNLILVQGGHCVLCGRSARASLRRKKKAEVCLNCLTHCTELVENCPDT